MKKANLLALLLLLCAVLLLNSACNQTKQDVVVNDKKQVENTNASNTVPGTPAKTSSPTTSAPKDIAGKYSINGTNENGGGTYEGTLDVTKHDEVYQLSWDTAGKKYDGVGVENGNTMAAAFADGANGKGCGVVLYKIDANGTLDGKAGYWGVNKSESEKATRTGGSDLVGEYDVKGKNTDGADYNVKLSVKSSGAGYTFSWTGNPAFEGFGIRQGDTVAVGIGGKQCGFVSYVVKPDGTLDGKWGGYGSTQVGTETAKKK